MSESVKRSYDASRRQAGARQSRARVLDAARAQFLTSGYRATTLARVAAEADPLPSSTRETVAVETPALSATVCSVTAATGSSSCAIARLPGLRGPSTGTSS